MSNQHRSVTLEQIEAEIRSEHLFTAAEGQAGAVGMAVGSLAQCPAELSLLTFCVLVLRNGFTVTGQSACADPAKFNADMGRKLAREDAIRQCWKRLGFRLRDQIAAEQGAAPAAKRYASSDIDDLRWATALDAFDPFGDKVNVWARMKDGKEFRGAFTPIVGERIGPAAAVHILRVANGEQP